MNKETIKQILVSQQERPIPRPTRRDLQVPLNSNKMVALIGIRRCGKTFILYETIQRLIDQGVDRRRTIYLNFEDDRLFPIHLKDLDFILKAHAELYPDLATERRYLFLDEVQNVPGWEKYIRRILDTEEVHIFVTGSSSHLLQRNVATAMRGRSISYEVFPLSFSEFIRFRNHEWKPYSTYSEAKTSALFEEYLQIGGFPEIVLSDPSTHQKIYKEYLDLIFYRDLLERYSLDNPYVVRMLLKHCLARPAGLLTVNKLYHDFISQEIKVGKETLYQYLEDMMESYILFGVPKHALSIRKQAVNPRKVFSIDVGLCRAMTPDPMLDRGHKLENVLFLHYRRRTEEIFYDANGTEIDFVLGLTKPIQLINTTYTLTSPEVFEREIASLRWGEKKHPHAKKLIIAHEIPPRKTIPGIQIEPAWKHLLTDTTEFRF